MASMQISVRIAGPGQVRSKVRIASTENEPFPELDNIVLESNLIDSRSHRLRIQFNESPAVAVANEPLEPAAESATFWEKVRARMGGIQLRLPL